MPTKIILNEFKLPSTPERLGVNKKLKKIWRLKIIFIFAAT